MKKVLVVEDEEVLCNLLVNLLEDEGYHAITAPNGKAGLTSLQQMMPDLIITDMMMPVLDGLGFCRAVRAIPEYQGIPLILVSAISDRIKEDCAWSAILRKPFNADDLLNTVSRLIHNT